MSTAGVKNTTESKKKHIESHSATAVHLQQKDGHIVGIGNLRVIIVQDESCWFAQGLEIDYAAQGKSLDDVRTQFEEGLCRTIHEHLRVYGTIINFLKPAPREIWQELLYDKLAGINRHSQISWHEKFPSKSVPNLPFEGINYIQQEKAA
jgi:hypothetical protein